MNLLKLVVQIMRAVDETASKWFLTIGFSFERCHISELKYEMKQKMGVIICLSSTFNKSYCVKCDFCFFDTCLLCDITFYNVLKSFAANR
jgi:hypothetical protein